MVVPMPTITGDILPADGPPSVAMARPFLGWPAGRPFVCFRASSPAVLFLALALLAWAAATAGAAPGQESCVGCHSDPNFLATNKKLFDYYQSWQDSIHNQEEVTCSDCHGGDPKATDKEKAHMAGEKGAGGMGAAGSESPVSYKNIPETCSRCHDEFYERFRESEHFKHMTGEKEEQRGPNCVTCHGSVNTAVLNVNTVKRTCQICHNEKTGNQPEVPGRAELVLNQFLSIHRFYRYFTKKSSLLKEPETFGLIEQRTTDLIVDWHTFDLDSIERQTRGLLDFLKEKSKEIRRKKKQ